MRFGILVLAVILLGGFIFWKDISRLVVKGTHTANAEVTNMDDKKKMQEPVSTVAISERWDLPSDLKEVSGIAYMGEQRFACVQDEAGTIYIYNVSANQIEKKISFAAPGDFEDVAAIGNTAWIVRADGRLYEVNLSSEKPAAKEYTTSLTVEHNVEGLAYDEANNRLLLAIKDDEPNDASYKGIYAFELATKSFVNDPVFKIELDHEVFSGSEKGKKGKQFKPSAIGVHPITKEIYVTDGPKARLLIMDSNGNIKDLVQLGKRFEQPEGISFNPQGDLFISNEGNKQPGNILQVTLK